MMMWMTACGGGGADGTTAPPPPPATIAVATVTVALSAAQVTVGQSATATAELRTALGAVLTGRAVSWTSSAPAVAAVDAMGSITALASGAATITATSEGRSGTSALSVLPAPVATVAITLALPTLTLGTTTTASAVLRDERGGVLADRTIAWSSSVPSVATVSATGAITTVSEGATIISATSEGRSASATLIVLPIPVATVSVAGPSTLSPGSTAMFIATPRDVAGTVLVNRVLTWTSSAANVATVSQSGTVTAMAPGVTTISVVSEGQRASTLLSVRFNIATVTLNGAGRPKVGDAYPFSAVALLTDGTVAERPLSWSIREAGRAVVTPDGVVTPLQAGAFTIVVTIDGVPWTAGYSAYDWEVFVSGGTSFVTLDADISVTNRSGASERPELIVSCSGTFFFLWVRTPHIITESGSVAYAFDNASPVGATWRELSPDFRTLWHPGSNSSTKAFVSQISAARRFGFAFGEFLGAAKATIFRVTGMAPLVAPLLSLCPNNAIMADRTSNGVVADASRLLTQSQMAAEIVAQYETARGGPVAERLADDAVARAVAGAVSTPRSALLTAWPTWTTTPLESKRATRPR